VIQIDSKVWCLLTKPPGELLTARNPFPDNPVLLLCAIDGKGHRHLLIPLDEADLNFNDTKSKGFIVVTRSLVIQGDELKKYLDIECIDSAGYTIFDVIGGEIFEKLLNDKSNPVQNIKIILMKWRRFWGQVPQNLLTKEEQLGLFAELWFLSVWLIPKIGPSAVMTWNGPWGSRNDFELADKSVEVKATMNSRGRIHRVNGLAQLENPDNGLLYLFSVRLQEDSTSINNLPALIDLCFNQLSDSPEALDRFESALYHIGYSPVHRDIYSEMNLHIVEENLFMVKDDFPRILNSGFVSGFPAGVEHLEYDINLNTFNHLIVCRHPQDLSFKRFSIK
jgi:hypothetical protein